MLYKKVCNHLVDHVCPTKRNGLLPRILETQSIWAILGVGVALFGFSQILRVTDYMNIKAEVYPSTVVALTNQDRQASGLAPLSVSPALEQAASLKVQNMISEEYFSHTSPSGVTPWHWFKQADYEFIYAGENLAINFDDSQSVESAWLASPTHRANIMSSNFTEIGIATARGTYQGTDTTFVVQLFGTPAVVNNVEPTQIEEEQVTNLPLNEPVAPSASENTLANPLQSTVAGESTEALNPALKEPNDSIVVVNHSASENEDFISVINTNPALVEVPATNTASPQIPFYARFVLNIDKYIGLFIELIVIALIMATATIVVREQNRRHRLHMAYGILTTIVLTSFLFIGRIGVFAQASNNLPQLVIEKTPSI